MHLRKHIINITLLLSLLSGNLFAQVIDENWAPISYNGKLVYVDLKDIKSFHGDDIYVWTIENLSSPLDMDEVNDEIYRTKTYYLINKSLLKYSILEVIYYDRKNNVIKDFTYSSTSDDPDIKYNYPLFKGSLVDLVLQRCLREIEKSN